MRLVDEVIQCMASRLTGIEERHIICWLALILFLWDMFTLYPTMLVIRKSESLFLFCKICVNTCFTCILILLHSASFNGKVKIVMLNESLMLFDQLPIWKLKFILGYLSSIF